MMSTVRFDTTGHRLRFIEPRMDGKALYRDLEDDSYVICRPESLTEYPPLTRRGVFGRVIRLGEVVA